MSLARSSIPFLLAAAFGGCSLSGSAPAGDVLAQVRSSAERIESRDAGQGNSRIASFREAKKIATRIHQGLHGGRSRTLYCRCPYVGKRVNLEDCGYVTAKQPKRARQLEWEHVVPAEAFGQSFVEWREGAPECRTRKKKYKGRRCAEKNPVFRKMEADLYNLFPEGGEVNGLRSNFSMAEVSALGTFAGTTFGKCEAKIFQGKFEPMDFAKGTVARTYLYMDQAYPGHGIVSDKNRKLFEAWDRMHPVEAWECELYRRIRIAQGNENPILRERCSALADAAKASSRP